MNSALKAWLIFICLLSTLAQASGQYSIKGQLQDSQRKYSSIVLEYLPLIKGLNRAEMGNIVNRVDIDSSGYFSMSGTSLPKEKRLYRLSLVKDFQGAGLSDGIWKNYVILELDHTSQIELVACDDISKTFANCEIKGSASSQAIQQFYDQLKQGFIQETYNMSLNKTELKEQFLRQKYSTDLKNYCDTSSHLNAALIAFVHLKNRDNELQTDPSFFDRFVQKITAQDPGSPYVIELKNEIASQQERLLGPKKDYSGYLIGFLGLCLIGLAYYAYSSKKKLSVLESSMSKEPVEDFSKKIEALSKKELEVYQLIVAGKSNKEIASFLFVETTTIKSHISKVYQKLGVKNRQEAIHKWPKNAS